MPVSDSELAQAIAQLSPDEQKELESALGSMKPDATDITEEDLQFERNLQKPPERSGYGRMMVGRGGSYPDPERSDKAAPYIAAALPAAALAPEVATIGPAAAAIGLGRSMLGGIVGGLGGAGLGYTLDRMGLTRGYGEGVLGTLGGLYGGANPVGVANAAEKLSMGRFTALSKILGAKLKGKSLEELADIALAKDLLAQGVAKDAKDAESIIKAATGPRDKEILRNIVTPKEPRPIPPSGPSAPPVELSASPPKPESIAAMEQRRNELNPLDAHVRAQRLAARSAQGEANVQASAALERPPIQVAPAQPPSGINQSAREAARARIAAEAPTTLEAAATGKATPIAANLADVATKLPPPKNESELIQRLGMLYRGDAKSKQAVIKAAEKVWPNEAERKAMMKLIERGNSAMPGRYY